MKKLEDIDLTPMLKVITKPSLMWLCAALNVVSGIYLLIANSWYAVLAAGMLYLVIASCYAFTVFRKRFLWLSLLLMLLVIVYSIMFQRLPNERTDLFYGIATFAVIIITAGEQANKS